MFHTFVRIAVRYALLNNGPQTCSEIVRGMGMDPKRHKGTIHAVMVTAESRDARYDFVSRYFAPQFGIDEDPVTGSAHCALGPYWAAKLRKHELSGKRPDAEASKGTRPVFQRGKWTDADIWRMESLKPGNQIDGLAVVEASNTTLFVPPEWRVRIDEYDIYWLERKDA